MVDKLQLNDNYPVNYPIDPNFQNSYCQQSVVTQISGGRIIYPIRSTTLLNKTLRIYYQPDNNNLTSIGTAIDIQLSPPNSTHPYFLPQYTSGIQKVNNIYYTICAGIWFSSSSMSGNGLNSNGLYAYLITFNTLPNPTNIQVKTLATGSQAEAGGGGGVRPDNYWIYATGIFYFKNKYWMFSGKPWASSYAFKYELYSATSITGTWSKVTGITRSNDNSNVTDNLPIGGQIIKIFTYGNYIYVFHNEINYIGPSCAVFDCSSITAIKLMSFLDKLNNPTVNLLLKAQDSNTIWDKSYFTILHCKNNKIYVAVKYPYSDTIAYHTWIITMSNLNIVHNSTTSTSSAHFKFDYGLHEVLYNDIIYMRGSDGVYDINADNSGLFTMTKLQTLPNFSQSQLSYTRYLTPNICAFNSQCYTGTYLNPDTKLILFNSDLLANLQTNYPTRLPDASRIPSAGSYSLARYKVYVKIS